MSKEVRDDAMLDFVDAILALGPLSEDEGGECDTDTPASTPPLPAPRGDPPPRRSDAGQQKQEPTSMVQVEDTSKNESKAEVSESEDEKDEEDELVARMRAYFQPVTDIGHEGMAKMDAMQEKLVAERLQNTDNPKSNHKKETSRHSTKSKEHIDQSAGTKEENVEFNVVSGAAGILGYRSDRAQKEKALFSNKSSSLRAAGASPPHSVNVITDADFHSIIGMYKDGKKKQQNNHKRPDWTPSGNPQ